MGRAYVLKPGESDISNMYKATVGCRYKFISADVHAKCWVVVDQDKRQSKG